MDFFKKNEIQFNTGIRLALLALSILLTALPAAAQERGVTLDTVTIGMANALTGPFIRAAEGLNADTGGLNFSFTPSNHQAMAKIYLTRISGNKIVPIQ